MLDQIRKGLFTASDFHKLMTCDKKPDELSSGAMTYIYKKVAETLAATPTDGFVSEAMQVGIDCELSAIEALQDALGVVILNTGDNQQTIVYCDPDSELFGEIAGTPDGVICSNGDIVSGVEVKCPESHTHVLNLLTLTNGASLKKHYPAYYWQVIGYMLLTDTNHWIFASYDRRFRYEENQLHYIMIERYDVDIEKLKARLILAIAAKNNILKNLKG